jgi:hypothetical protein
MHQERSLHLTVVENAVPSSVLLTEVKVRTVVAPIDIESAYVILS